MQTMLPEIMRRIIIVSVWRIQKASQMSLKRTLWLAQMWYSNRELIQFQTIWPKKQQEYSTPSDTERPFIITNAESCRA